MSILIGFGLWALLPVILVIGGIGYVLGKDDKNKND